MSTLNPILATLLRFGGALAGAGVVYLVSDATLMEGLASAGLAGQVAPEMARIGACVGAVLVGFVIASQVVGLLDRSHRTPHGTKSEAAESVPRLRRHLVEGGGPQRGSAIPDYLDPDPAPTKPVAVSFAELGLEHPSAQEYPMPAGHQGEPGDDFAFADAPDRPDHAGSASEEWDEPAATLKTSVPPPAPAPAEPRMSAARAEAAAQARELAARNAEAAPVAPEAPAVRTAAPAAQAGPVPFGAGNAARHAAESVRDLPVIDLPHHDLPATDEVGLTSFDTDDSHWDDAGWDEDGSFEAVGPAPSPEPVRAGSPPRQVEAWPVAEPYVVPQVEPAPGHRPAPAPLATTVPDPDPIPAATIPPMPPHAEPAQPRFALSSSGESDWYDGSGDEEEDAEDDGAGYGSLIDIGLGKSHAPRGGVGQRGEAGLPALARSGAMALVPHGKPQDFRLREALAELQRLDRS